MIVRGLRVLDTPFFGGKIFKVLFEFSTEALIMAFGIRLKGRPRRRHLACALLDCLYGSFHLRYVMVGVSDVD